MSEMRYTVKDSVFTFVFKQPEYARKLYLALHPEDSTVTEADCKLVTLENVLTTGMYNDVGLQVRNVLILLVEAQSIFSVNIALRMLLYLAATYKEYVEEYRLNLYGTAPVTIPRPELYVVYTGDRANVPEVLRLSDLYEGTGSADVEVKVLRGNGTGDIVDQYVRFCKISDEERKKHGRSRKAIEETLRRCIEENVLAPFLATRQKEVAEIMVTLFDQEKIMEIHDYHIAEGARKDGLQQGLQQGLQKGRSEGRTEGLTEGTLQSIQNLIKNMGLSVERAMTVLGVSEADQPKYAEMLKQ
ncbi:MAG: hypothetical protein HFF62_13145 [Oscillospiraceae bacterium]|jgi:hypothetical protein|nr:hypothetical protein [Oscillospiraceae bacterium]